MMPCRSHESGHLTFSRSYEEGIHSSLFSVILVVHFFVDAFNQVEDVLIYFQFPQSFYNKR